MFRRLLTVVFLLGVVTYDVILGDVTVVDKEKRSDASSFRATNDVSRYWSSRVIPYEISNQYPRDEVDLIKAAMDDWADNTCLTFRPKRPGDKSYLSISSGSGCSSALGRMPRGQVLDLSRSGCLSMSTIQHEIGHALGLIHEHQHPHRDKGVRIIRNEVTQQDVIWFDKIASNTLDFFRVDYDMDSVMHYDSYAFSRRGQRTMIAKDPSVQHRLDNYHKMLSFSDALIVSRMLKCHELCPRRVNCPSDGYVDANCICRTPQEFFARRCKNSGGEQFCLQNLSNCGSQEVAVKCMKMCDFCPMYKIPRKKKTGSCVNEYYDDEQCEKWARDGLCTDQTHRRIINKRCAKSCNSCGQDVACIDDNDCPGYPVEYCEPGHQYNSFMMDHCRTRCGLCEGNGNGNSNKGNGGNANCKDEPECSQYPMEYCRRTNQYYSYMKQNCKSHCGFC